MGLSRRSFLGLGAGGLAILALGGTGIALQPSVLRAPATPLQTLSPRAFSVVAALADRICATGPGFPSAAELHVAEGVDALLATMEPGTVAELKQALMLFENALTGLLFDGRPKTFTSSTPAEQDEILEHWRTSSVQLRRKVYKALRGIIAAAYYGQPAVYAAVGYPGPPDFSALVAAREAERAAGSTAGSATPPTAELGAEP